MSNDEQQEQFVSISEGPAAPYLVKPQPARHSREGGDLGLFEQMTLGDVLSVVRGVTYKKENARQQPADGYVAVLRATNIQNGAIGFDDLVYVPASNVSEAQLLREGDIVIAASSGSRSVVGKAAPLQQSWRGSFGAFCFGLRPNPGTDARFIAWFMQTSEYRNRVSELAAGVNINNLRAKHIEDTPFRRPPLTEQRRIVAELETQLTRLDASVAALKRVQANLKRYRASVLKAACEGRLVPTEAEQYGHKPELESASELLSRIHNERRMAWAGRGKRREPALPNADQRIVLPAGWVLATIDQVADVGTGATPTRGRAAFYEGGAIPWITSSVVNRSFVDEASEFVTNKALEETNLTLYPVGTLLLAMYGEGKTRGKCSELRIAATTNQALAALQVSLALRPYLKVFLMKNYEDTRRVASGGVQPNLNISLIRSIEVPLPPLAEQHRIVAEVERRLSVIERLEATVTANLKRAERLRQSVLARAFEIPHGSN